MPIPNFSNATPGLSLSKECSHILLGPLLNGQGRACGMGTVLPILIRILSTDILLRFFPSLIYLSIAT